MYIYAMYFTKMNNTVVKKMSMNEHEWMNESYFDCIIRLLIIHILEKIKSLESLYEL